ncbi:MAG: SpoIIE family protein phosphatase [Acidimicrobiia bacterium]
MTQPESLGSRGWVLAGVVAIAIVTFADLVTQGDAVLTGALIVGPVIAAFGARTRQVAALGAFAVFLAIVLGAINGNFLEEDHVIRTVVVALGVIGATLLTLVREQRDRELARTRPQAADAQRLRLALDAGEMGTWRWDLSDNAVDWDTKLEALFGLEPGTFGGSFETYESLIHADDRDRARAAVDEGMATGMPWRFDYRVVWPDGSVHWLEGRGEPERDHNGVIVGATGITVNVDERREAEARRTALLEAERRARQASEEATAVLQRLGQLTLALSRGATFDEVGRTIVHHGMEVLDAQFGWFGTVDASAGTLVARAYEGYRDGVMARYTAIPLDRVLPVTEAIQTGESFFVESPEDRAIRYRHFRDGQAHTAFVVVPINAAEDAAAAVASFGFRDRRKFSEEERRYMAAVVDACAQALQRVVLYELAQLNRARLRTTLDISEQLAQLDEPEAVVETAARFSATRIGRFSIVYTMELNGGMTRATAMHADPDLQPVLERVLERGIEPLEAVRKVADTRIGAPVPSLSDDLDAGTDAELKQLAIVSLIAVPMTVADRTLGVIVIGDDRPLPLGAADLELATDIGRRSASSFERGQLWQWNREQLEVEQRMVEVLQQSIIPERLPEISGTEIAAAYRPADTNVDVGGDWYDAFSVESCPLVLVVGDVAGHGIDAASLMGRVRNGIRAYAVQDADPGALLERADEMVRTLDPDSMVTAVIGCYDPDTRLLRWSRAGHPPPLACYTDGRTEYLEGVNATPLGTVGRRFETAEVELPERALVVFYTDGLIERRRHSLDEGLEWLAGRVRALRHHDVQQLCRTLSVETFTENPSDDDLCILVLRTS